MNVTGDSEAAQMFAKSAPCERLIIGDQNLAVHARVAAPLRLVPASEIAEIIRVASNPLGLLLVRSSADSPYAAARRSRRERNPN